MQSQGFNLNLFETESMLSLQIRNHLISLLRMKQNLPIVNYLMIRYFLQNLTDIDGMLVSIKTKLVDIKTEADITTGILKKVEESENADFEVET